MREIEVKLTLKPETGEVETFMQGQLGWNQQEQGMFCTVMMELVKQALDGKIK